MTCSGGGGGSASADIGDYGEDALARASRKATSKARKAAAEVGAEDAAAADRIHAESTRDEVVAADASAENDESAGARARRSSRTRTGGAAKRRGGMSHSRDDVLSVDDVVRRLGELTAAHGHAPPNPSHLAVEMRRQRRRSDKLADGRDESDKAEVKEEEEEPSLAAPSSLTEEKRQRHEQRKERRRSKRMEEEVSAAAVASSPPRPPLPPSEVERG